MGQRLQRFWMTACLLMAPVLAGCSAPLAGHGGTDQQGAVTWAFVATGLDVAQQGEPLVVAVLDGGIEPHPELDGTVKASWEAASLSGSPRSGHGTQIAGILAAEGLRGGAASGPAVELLDVRVLDQYGNGSPADVADGIAWAVDRGASIIAASFAMEHSDQELSAAVRSTLEHGVTIIAATANSFGETESYPAAYEGVIGVTAIDERRRRAPLASAVSASVAAPGKDVLTTDTEGGLSSASGTSIAAAVATAVVAGCFSSDVLASEDVEAVLIGASEDSAKFGEREIPIVSCR